MSISDRDNWDEPIADGRQVEVVEVKLDFLEVLFVDEAVDVVVARHVDGVVLRVVGAGHDAAGLAIAEHHLIAFCARRQPTSPSLSLTAHPSYVRPVSA